MIGRRILYAVSLLVAFVFYLAYKMWFAWILFLGILWLPLLSLVLSLPAMLTVQFSLRCPKQVRVGVPAKTALETRCRFPVPPVKAVLRLENTLTQERYIGRPGEYVPVDQCGLVLVRWKTLRVYDYLGLFGKKVKSDAPCSLYVEPRPLPVEQLPAAATEGANSWIPKTGGGFSENHDLRPYREGDDLRMIHWKLSEKTGELIYREPIVPLQQETALVLTLSGTPEALERKLGRMVYVSRRLLEKQEQHSILCRTGAGEMRFSVTEPYGLEQALHTLLSSPVTRGEWIPHNAGTAGICLIGGDADG